MAEIERSTSGSVKAAVSSSPREKHAKEVSAMTMVDELEAMRMYLARLEENCARAG